MTTFLLPDNCRRSAALVWEEYRRQQCDDSTRVQEHRDRMISYGGKTMKYYVTTQGEMPNGGYALYIALHGGGGHSAEFNDSSWERMQKLLPAEYSPRNLFGPAWHHRYLGYALSARVLRFIRSPDRKHDFI